MPVRRRARPLPRDLTRATPRGRLLAVLRAMLKLPHAHVERALGALKALRGDVGAQFLRALLEQASAQ